MKFLLVLALIGVFSVQASDDLKINGDFKGSTIGAIAPRHWWKNFMKQPGIGESKVVQGKEAGELALHVKTGKLETPFYSTECTAKAGDVLEIEADVTGTGVIRYGYYAYDARHQYIGSAYGRLFTLKPEEDDYKDKLTVKDFPGGKVTAFIRIAIGVRANSDVTISDIEAEFDDKD